ncbi:purine-cytosine permease family protein [Bacillus salipaludis]|uniref:Cytosine permease n=1 Tax=Bacillus salipaludis TaxID=2547811 RepID=A0AA90TTA9_9BACI|nr:cytosine permease [Bacillus salipaludis]MDQ6597224.1 cytosine permease [Bacillus salipaludis]
MKIENHFIDFIPEEERHGSVRNLFSIWFSANMHILTIVTGALAIVFGLNLFWAVVSILLGNLIGAIFMATHSVQGPNLGIPQMIQSRAQFGIIGAIIPLLIVVIMYIGFFASNAVVSAQALSSASSIPINIGIALICITGFMIALYGYDLIHIIVKYLTIAFTAVFFFVTIAAFGLDLPAGSWSPSEFKLAPFLLGVSVFAAWQLLYAPYVADYSRYLPSKTPSSKTFFYTYTGTVIGTVWMMVLGAVLATAIPKFLDNPGKEVSHLLGPIFVPIIYAIIIMGLAAINGLNLYGAFMSITTIIETFTKLKGTIQTRFWLMLSCLILCGGLAIWGNGDFLNNFTNLILFLSYFMFPWTAINLIDYYFLKKGHYNVTALLDLNGQYGKINWIALGAYIIAILLEIPFINSSFYVGPLVDNLGGTDLAWIVGLIVPVLLYYYPMKKLKSKSISNELDVNEQLTTRI